jgi:hypothetical protein
VIASIISWDDGLVLEHPMASLIMIASLVMIASLIMSAFLIMSASLIMIAFLIMSASLVMIASLIMSACIIRWDNGPVARAARGGAAADGLGGVT